MHLKLNKCTVFPFKQTLCSSDMRAALLVAVDYGNYILQLFNETLFHGRSKKRHYQSFTI